MRRAFAIVIAAGALVAACGGVTQSPSAASPSAPGLHSPAASATAAVEPTAQPSFVVPPGTAAPSAARVRQWAADALAFAAAFDAAYDDPEAVFAGFAENARTRDPSNGDYLFDGKAAIVSAWEGLVRGWPDLEAQPTAVYVSSDGALVATDVDNLAPDRLYELRRYRWDGNRVTEFELWYRVDQLGGCQPGTCEADATRLADRYLAAWSGASTDGIAAMYHDDATFSDTLIGVDAVGPAAIAETAEQRFGTGAPACQTIDLYGLTNGGDQIIGLAIHATCAPGGGRLFSGVESIFLIRFGSYVADGFEPEANGLITSEDVYYDADSLAASDLYTGE